MRLGITMFATDQTMPPHTLAIAAEERGFSSLYLPEHTHIPTSRRTPSAATLETSGVGASGFLRGDSGDETLSESYARTLDPFVSLAMAASVTSTLTLGTGVALLAQREPIVTAKAVASLQHLSGGRVVLGVGYGWNVEEAEDHGVVWGERRALVAERLRVMRALWRDEVAAYKGEFEVLSPSWAWPKADVPVLFGGGGGPKLFAAIAELGDGWMPIGGAGVAEALPKLSAAFEAAGRDPATASVIPFGTLPTPGKLEHFAALGVTETVLRVTSGTRDAVLRELDAHARFL
ncbi:TIGR03619 family F420-dependent LLM class oxidoreductase [Actinocorallia sp. A-T 12471]|uniref:TIGR03619 family F420-dependent LLM class oxidoreductase n=1 Tax=Actinocorallia sp. A-T 12471 TaxID=3089813 RepID=UPI0029CBD2C0|nr:TIGR03619 family F420-dependent LLM class oxidoreductase [Actinocorallia sp. A-T 12471]MDX6743338.1 TIGR03619 family F420-dependent LLM class oxidoreductase [Actinocorallia sp. A-T 12471]